MINWKVRLRQKPFLVALFSALVLFAQQLGAMFGYDLSNALGEDLTEVFNTLLLILSIMGVVIDPTTKGLMDSE